MTSATACTTTKEKSMKRFTIRKKTFVYRNSMIAGSPVTKRFQMFCIFDRNWENERKCLSFRGYENTQYGQRVRSSYELRAAFKNGDKAKELCAQMNEESVKLGNPRSISFNCDNAWDWFDDKLEVTGFQK